MNEDRPRVRRINPETLPRPAGYAQVVEVAGGRTVLVSGQIPLDAAGALVGRGDPAAQVRQAFANVGRALEAAGAGFGDVVKVQVFLTDMAHLAVLRQVRAEFIDPERPPAMTTVQVAGLVDPEMIVEVDAVAVVPGPHAAPA
ncbi:MAG: RidA family protein [Chloroflexota bacterium]